MRGEVVVAETMDQMLARVRDGYTVKAVYKTHDGGRFTIEGVVHASEQTRWYEFTLPEDGARLALCQITGQLPHAMLSSVVSVTPPPVYTNTDDTEYQIGDVVEAGPMYGDGALVRAQQWMFIDDYTAEGYDWRMTRGEWSQDAGKKVFTRSELPSVLRLVGRVQPYPLTVNESFEVETEVKKVFATAQRMIVAEIRGVGTNRRSHHSFAFTRVEGVVYVKADDVARLVEGFDLNDAYPPPEWD
jgi:hypothetical protein